MKKLFLVACCCVLAFCLSSCESSGVEKSNENLGAAKVQMANPFLTFDNLEEAANETGFSIELPDVESMPNWIGNIVYRSTTVNYKLLEIIYSEDDSYEREIRFRKGITDKEDMSGDFNSYEKEEKIDVDGRSVTVRSNGDKIYGAIWRDGDFAYSVHVSDGMGQDELLKIIKVIK